MDDILELLPKLIDPIVRHINKYLATALAIIGALVAFFVNRREKQKRRKRYKEIRDMLLFLIKAGGHQWYVESAVSTSHTPRTSYLRQWAMKYPVQLVAWFTRLLVTGKSILRSVLQMSKTWIAGLLGYVAFFIKQLTGWEIGDEMIDVAAELVLGLIMLIAMIKNMKKGGTPVEKPTLDDHEFVGDAPTDPGHNGSASA